MDREEGPAYYIEEPSREGFGAKANQIGAKTVQDTMA